MRFRLSSFLLTITLLGVAVAWYIDHHRHRSDEIVGVWYYPTPDQPFRKGQETLTIRADGTFTLQHAYATYSGTYRLAGNGIALFHVTSKQQVFAGIPPETYDVDKTYRCRIARHSHSNLMIVDLDPDVGSFRPDMPLLGNVKVVLPEDVDISWRCYTSISHRTQNEASWKSWKSWKSWTAEGEKGRESD